jgi:hypothetical protein
LAVRTKLLELKEQESMIALFPTFSRLANKVKQALSTDVSLLWQELLQVAEPDEEVTVYVVGTQLYW